MTTEQAMHGPRDGVTGSPSRVVIVGLIFCISGFSALIYQVAWQRILALQSGVGIYSVAMIVAAFMSGLGVGSYSGGLLSNRLRPAAALRAFAYLELGIGLFAVASRFLYYDLLYLQAAWLFEDPWRTGVVHFLALLLPTTMMGMSLPFLTQAMVQNVSSASRTIGTLYGLNTIGAALGALLAPWLLIRFFGVPGALYFGAAGNIVAGATALVLGSARGSPQPSTESVGPAGPVRSTAAPEQRPFALWLGLYTLSGFCALSLEILWFRIIDVAVKSTAFTFGTVLAIFLLGLGLGSVWGGRWAARLAHPLQAFLICQSLVLAFAGAAVLLLVVLPADWPWVRDYVVYWRSYEEFMFGGQWDWGAVLDLYVALPLFLYGVPTLLMGVSFGILQRAVQNEPGTTGLKVGVLQAGNIVGNVVGSLLTGLLLLSVLGTGGSLRLLIGIGLLYPLIGYHYKRRRPVFVALALVLGALLVMVPRGEALWGRLHGVPAGGALVEEDATMVAAISPEAGRMRVSVNGKGHSWLPFGGIHTRLGAVPAMIHPDPKDVAIIGLGSGDTAWAAGCREETQEITVFELGASQERLLSRVAAASAIPSLQRFLLDDRVELRTADGRIALATNSRRYDLIEADALRPHSAYSGNLYSEEFFRLCASKLKPGGLMCSWVPTPRIYRSFHAAFAHVVEMDDGSILIGSNEPIEIDLAVLTARLNSSRIRSYFPAPVLEGIARAVRATGPSDPARHGEYRPNLDLYPRDEFRAPGPAAGP